MNRRRIANVMQRHMLHSEHAALCYIEAERRERAAKRIGMCPWCGEGLHPGRKCSNEASSIDDIGGCTNETPSHQGKP